MSSIAQAAAEALRTSRDLMNHGGRHWIKGSEKLWVDRTHEPGDNYGPSAAYQPTPGYEPAYCSVGALRATRSPALAFIALAEVIDPQRMRGAREDIAAEDYDPRTDDAESELLDFALEVIMSFNDDSSTGWADVRSAFTRAARRLAQRKSS